MFLTMAGAALLSGAGAYSADEGEKAMFGLIGKMKAVEGKRADLAEILLGGIAGMPGCLSYIVANDPGDGATLWITEVWDSAESHKASLSLPSVQEAIRLGRPMIAGMEMVATTAPIGGQGL